jgi:cold shock CspA family protein
MREQGRVKLWKDSYGFISADRGVDHFVHIKHLPAGLDHLVVGSRVSFLSEPGRNNKGPVATSVSVVV